MPAPQFPFGHNKGLFDGHFGVLFGQSSFDFAHDLSLHKYGLSPLHPLKLLQNEGVSTQDPSAHKVDL